MIDPEEEAQLVALLRRLDPARTPLDAPVPERLLTLPDRLRATADSGARGRNQGT